MRENRIKDALFRFFVELYKNLPAFDEVFRHLMERDFLLVGIYEMHHQKKLAGWCNMLFANKRYHAKSGRTTEHVFPQV